MVKTGTPNFLQEAWRVDLLTTCRGIKRFRSQAKDVDVGKFCTRYMLTAQLTTELTSFLLHLIHLLYEAQFHTRILFGMAYFGFSL
jgi:hypothetical protein